MSSLRLRKVLTNPIVGQRPNAPLETWNRLKKATAELRNKPEPEPNSVTLVENGPNGEILLWYADSRVCQVWDWGHVEQHVLLSGGFSTEPSPAFAEKYSGDSLNLVTSFETAHDVLAMAIFPCSFGSLLVLLLKADTGHIMEVFHQLKLQTFSLESSLSGGVLQIKASQEYLLVASSEGYISIFKAGNPSEYLQKVSGDPLMALESCTRAIICQDNLDEAKTGAFLKTLVQDSPMFDIVGSWLVYSPTQTECNYFKKLHQSRKGAKSKNDYTPVKLPSSGPLLSRVASALSNSAADTLLSLTDFSTRAVKKSKDIIEKDISLRSVSSSISSSIYSTASAVYNSKFKGDSLIKIIDLSTGNTIALFKAPGGVSHLSLNEYDLQLAQANSRGDSIYLWDLYKLPKEVSLVGKFLRGKTSARITEMVWFMSNDTIDGRLVSNSGLGCITERSGSIHWFNVNYLFSGKERGNYPNGQVPSTSRLFLNSWTLPSIGANRFVKLPSYSNVSDETKRSEFKNARTRDVFSRLNQLAFVDQDLNLRLISTLNGKHNFKYILPGCPVQEEPAGYGRNLGPLTYRSEPEKTKQVENPISQAEIETCEPYLAFIQNENSKIAVYDFEESEFWARYTVFGDCIPHITRDFSAKKSVPEAALVAA